MQGGNTRDHIKMPIGVDQPAIIEERACRDEDVRNGNEVAVLPQVKPQAFRPSPDGIGEGKHMQAEEGIRQVRILRLVQRPGENFQADDVIGRDLVHTQQLTQDR